MCTRVIININQIIRFSLLGKPNLYLLINCKSIITSQTQQNCSSSMNNLTKASLSEYIPTIYTTPCTLSYTQNGVHKKWDIFAERNGVVIIVYNSSRNVLSLVKQFRPSVYISKIPLEDRNGNIDVEKYPSSLGITLEFCGGLEDKDASIIQIAKEEILEECGYDVPLSKLEKINTIKNLTFSTGARSTFYYCEVTDEMRVSKGGGVDNEFIEVVELPVCDVIKYMSQEEVCSPMNFMYGMHWFLYNKYNK